ncbi:hypothetical protein ACTXT7_006297 [Hymenolepis weldensis]
MGCTIFNKWVSTVPKFNFYDSSPGLQQMLIYMPSVLVDELVNKEGKAECRDLRDPIYCGHLTQGNRIDRGIRLEKDIGKVVPSGQVGSEYDIYGLEFCRPVLCIDLNYRNLNKKETN